jgi:hypothetical protein
MKSNFRWSSIAFLGLTGVLVCFGTALTIPAEATPSISGPLTAGQFDALNGSGANYGTPSNATFPDGPFTVGSGTGTELTGGPAASNATSILLVLSATDPSALGAGTVDLTFGSLKTVDFSSSDFYSTSATDFPTTIKSIANGAVNGIKFPNSDHAGALIDLGSLLVKDADLGLVTITSSINLRVDVFGVNKGLIVGNAANSGAEGVSPGLASTPEPSTALLFGTGLLALFFIRNHRGRSRTFEG